MVDQSSYFLRNCIINWELERIVWDIEFAWGHRMLSIYLCFLGLKLKRHESQVSPILETFFSICVHCASLMLTDSKIHWLFDKPRHCCNLVREGWVYKCVSADCLDCVFSRAWLEYWLWVERVSQITQGLSGLVNWWITKAVSEILFLSAYQLFCCLSFITTLAHSSLFERLQMTRSHFATKS